MGHLGGDRHPEGMDAGIGATGGNRPCWGPRKTTQRRLDLTLD
jgi:hypothetical protein